MRYSFFGLLVFITACQSTPTAENITSKKVEDSISPERKKFEQDSLLNANVLANLGEAESFAADFDMNNYKDKPAANYVALCLEIYSHGKYVTTLSESDDAEIKKRAIAVRKKLTSLMVKNMPVIRKRWAESVATKLWENDIEVKAIGKGYQVLEFTGAIFAANKNIKDVHLSFDETFSVIKMKQVRYKWYSMDEEYTYYTIHSEPDDSFEH